MKTFSTARVLSVIAVSLFCWLIPGSIAAVLFQRAATGLHGLPEDAAAYVYLHIPYIFLFLSMLLGTHLLLHTDFRTILSGSSGVFRRSVFWKAFLIYIALMAAAALIRGKSMHFNRINQAVLLLNAIPVLLLTPMQALSEELLFRVMPLRLVTKEKMPESLIASLPLIIISGLLFALPHIGNREVAEASNALLPVICYFLWGAGAMFISIATDGFETAAAMHIANNLFIALVVNYEGSSMPVHTLFTAPPAGNLATLFETIAVFSVIYIHACIKGLCRPRFMPGRRN